MTDLEMMNNPSNWPMFPLLPLKNRLKRHENRMPLFAVLSTGGGRYVITYCGIDSTADEVLAAKAEEITPEKAIADGWIVD